MKIEEVTNTFFKWRPLIFPMEFPRAVPRGFARAATDFFYVRKSGIRSFSALVRRVHHLCYADCVQPKARNLRQKRSE